MSVRVYRVRCKALWEVALIGFHVQNKAPFLWDPLSFFKVLGRYPASVPLDHLHAFLASPLGAVCPSSSPFTSLSFFLAQVYFSRLSTDQEAAGCQETVPSFVWILTIQG